MSLNKKIEKLGKQRPKYEIDPNYAANKAIAGNLAYGRNNAILNAEAGIEQSTANALTAARDASGTSGSLMDAIIKATANQNVGLQQLAGQEAALQTDAMGNYMAAGTALAEERDKAWNYNVNEPYQQKMAGLHQRKANRQQTLNNVLQIVGGVVGAVGGGLVGGGKSK